MNYLTRDDLLDLHAYAVERYGGLLGIKSQDRLQDVLAAPARTMFGSELYPDLVAKAAIMIYLIVKSHPFLGGNQTTAFFVLLRFLAINYAQLQPDVPLDAVVQALRDLNNSDLDKEGFEQQLRAWVLIEELA